MPQPHATAFAFAPHTVRIRFDPTRPPARDGTAWASAAAVAVVALSLLCSYVVVLRGAVSQGEALRANFAQNTPAQKALDAQALRLAAGPGAVR